MKLIFSSLYPSSKWSRMHYHTSLRSGSGVVPIYRVLSLLNPPLASSIYLMHPSSPHLLAPQLAMTQRCRKKYINKQVRNNTLVWGFQCNTLTWKEIADTNAVLIRSKAGGARCQLGCDGVTASVSLSCPIFTQSIFCNSPLSHALTILIHLL